MTADILTSLAQAGLAGIGIFGLWQGATLLQQQISKAPPKDELEARDSKWRFSVIVVFLSVSLLTAISAGALEIIKDKSTQKITITLSPYKKIPDDLKPQVIIGTSPITIEKSGHSNAEISEKDTIYVQLDDLFSRLSDNQRIYRELNNQISLQSNGEIGYDDPNN